MVYAGMSIIHLSVVVIGKPHRIHRVGMYHNYQGDIYIPLSTYLLTPADDNSLRVIPQGPKNDHDPDQ